MDITLYIMYILHYMEGKTGVVGRIRSKSLVPDLSAPPWPGRRCLHWRLLCCRIQCGIPIVEFLRALHPLCDPILWGAGCPSKVDASGVCWGEDGILSGEHF